MKETSEYSCRRLWQSVIIAALTDLKFGDYAAFQEAEEWIFSDCSDFNIICDMADIEKSKVVKCAINLVDTRPFFENVKHKRHYALESNSWKEWRLAKYGEEINPSYFIPSSGECASKKDEDQIRADAAQRLIVARQKMKENMVMA